METAVKIWTDEELMALPKDGQKHELINGEILSPWDRTIRTHDKMVEYFDSGARMAWVINPEEKSALVYRGADAGRLLRVADALDGEDVLPGFRLPLAELFAELSFE